MEKEHYDTYNVMNDHSNFVISTLVIQQHILVYICISLLIFTYGRGDPHVEFTDMAS